MVRTECVCGDRGLSIIESTPSEGVDAAAGSAVDGHCTSAADEGMPKTGQESARPLPDGGEGLRKSTDLREED